VRQRDWFPSKKTWPEWAALCAFAASVVVAIALRDPGLVFSGALVSVTFLVFSLQRRLDRREREGANPKPVFHATTVVHERAGFNTATKVGELKFAFRVSSPGDAMLFIERIRVFADSVGEIDATDVTWKVLHPKLADSLHGPGSSFPVPLFPHGLTEITAVLETHDQAAHKAVSGRRAFPYTVFYRIGNNPELREERCKGHK